MYAVIFVVPPPIVAAGLVKLVLAREVKCSGARAAKLWQLAHAGTVLVLSVILIRAICNSCILSAAVLPVKVLLPE